MSTSGVQESIAVDARAKIIWGESPEKVFAFLQSKNVGDKDARELIDELLCERAESIRSDGLRKIWIGVGFTAAPLAYYFVCLGIGFFSLKLFSALVLLGLFGLAKLANGLSMMLRPRRVKGDLSTPEE